MNGTELIPVESVNPVEIFTGGKLDDLLNKIKAHTESFEADITTDKGRKDVASLAYKVARSKTTIDDAGKSLVSEWKDKAKAVDAERKKARDFLDGLKETVRKPLTDWEQEQERIAQEAKEAERKRQEEAEAARIAEIERREAEIMAKEEAIRKAEDERRAKEAAERAERERLEREEQIRKEASERAEREAAEAKEAARVAAERAEKEKKEAAERAEREKQEAIRLAEENARKEAEEKERARLAEAARIKREEEQRAKDREHRKVVMSTAADALIEEGVTPKVANSVISLIAQGSIPAVEIKF